jgi:hypothetical protein
MLRWTPWLTLAAPLALAVMTTLAVVDAYTPAPFQDYWDTLYWWREAVRKGFPWSWLPSQHNEHRILLPRLVFLADFAWFRGTNVLNMAVIALTQALGALLFLRAGLRRGGALAIVGTALALGLIVSLVQWENLFWGFQVQMTGVAATAAWAIWHFSHADADGANRAGRLGAAVLLLAVATFTMANGLFAGIAMVLAGLAARRNWRSLALVGALTAGLMGLYLWGYHPVASHSPASAALQDPAGFVTYALNYLGNPCALGDRPRAAAFGAIGTALTAAMTVLVFRDRGRDPAQLAMFGIVLFAGMSAAATALGRLSLGLEYSLSSRYATGACYFWAAQALFWAFRVQGWSRVFQWALGAAFVTALLVLFKVQDTHRPGLEDADRRIERAVAAMVSGRADDEAFKSLYPDPDKVRYLGDFLCEQRMSVFARRPDDAPPCPRLTTQ